VKSLLLTVCIFLALPSYQKLSGLQGEWAMCLASLEKPTPVCTVAHVDTLSALADRPMVLYHPFTHSMDFVALMGSGGGRLSQFGNLVVMKTDSVFRLELGTPQGRVYSADGGNIVATLTRTRDAAGRWADTIDGQWRRTCRAGCSGSGRIMMWRQAPR
jgi:hypothetical protein